MARILVADDDAYIVRVLVMWLTRHGHEVLTASNGETALAAVVQQRVDLIISDMNMPVRDGVSLAQNVRARIGADIPMLMLTARCDQEKLTEQLASFHVRVYPKPFLPSQLVFEIDRLLKEKEGPTEATVSREHHA